MPKSDPSISFREFAPNAIAFLEAQSCTMLHRLHSLRLSRCLEQKTDSQSSSLNPIKAMTFGQSEVGRPSTSSRATISTGRSRSTIIEYVCP